MAPPKQPAAGMRSIASFFAPKAKAPPKEQLPGIANGAIAPDPSESPADSPPSADARGATRAAKSAKTSARAAPGSATPGGWDGTTPPAAPSTAVADDEQLARIDPSPPEAESPPGDAPTTATTANGAAGDVGRRIAVLWKSERRYFAGNVAAYDAVNGKHHVRYDDGDEEWIALSRHDLKWDVDAEEAEPKKKAGAKRPAAGRKRKADAAEDAPETSDEDEEEEEDDDDDDYDEEDEEEEEEEEPSPYNGKRQTPTKSARKVAPVPPRNPRQPAHSPCMRLVGLAVEKESIWQGDHGPTRGVVTGFHESVRYWGETFDVLLDENHLDAGLTFEELLLILANESDKERSVSDESWALAMGLLRLDDPGSSRVVRQFRLQYPQYFGFDRVGETEGKYEAKILDKKGMLHHFAYHFTTKWAAAAAHEILARRLEFHGPGVMRGTRRNFKPDAPWDALVGVLIAGAKWRPRVRSNATGDDRGESDAADKKRSETLMSFIKWDHKSGRLRLAA